MLRVLFFLNWRNGPEEMFGLLGHLWTVVGDQPTGHAPDKRKRPCGVKGGGTCCLERKHRKVSKDPTLLIRLILQPVVAGQMFKHLEIPAA